MEDLIMLASAASQCKPISASPVNSPMDVNTKHLSRRTLRNTRKRSQLIKNIKKEEIIQLTAKMQPLTDENLKSDLSNKKIPSPKNVSCLIMHALK
nr:hypothetical protein, homolog of RGHV1 ORF53 [Macronycteris gammaherpesvirus 1]